MGLHADRATERDVLARKVDRMRAELDAYAARLAEAEQVLADTPEDDPEPELVDSGLTVSGAGAAHDVTVMTRDHTG